MIMKKLLICLSFLFSVAVTSAQEQLVMDANAELRAVSGSFTSIQVSGGIDLYLSQSESEAVAVSASQDKYKAFIVTVVENNVLKIYYNGDKGINLRNKSLRAYVSFRTIDMLEASGASDVILADKIKVPSLHIKVSGASDFKGDVTVEKLKLNLSGASDMHISGTATNLEINSSGASDVSGFGLVAETCIASASGASDINISVSRELVANTSGASDIVYAGDAVLKEVNKSGSGTIRRRG
jgi:hypothetical protein